MGEDGCFGEGSTPAESIAVTSSNDIIIFEMGIRLFYHPSFDGLGPPSHLVQYTRSPAAASPASDFSLPTTLPFFLPLAVVFSPSHWESLATGAGGF